MMKTQHGVQMSPRKERLWRFIREECRINLTDFSTDEDVERAQASLQAGEAKLMARVEQDPDNRDLVNLLGDYQNIMNRRPQARVKGRHT